MFIFILISIPYYFCPEEGSDTTAIPLASQNAYTVQCAVSWRLPASLMVARCDTIVPAVYLRECQCKRLIDILYSSVTPSPGCRGNHSLLNLIFNRRKFRPDGYSEWAERLFPVCISSWFYAVKKRLVLPSLHTICTNALPYSFFSFHEIFIFTWCPTLAAQ
jgi:hypothetical protein